jgi:hypothetical protein
MTPAQLDTAPPLDTTGAGPSRAERRRGRGRPDLPWHGPIPNTGRSLGRARAAAAGRWRFARMPARTAVRVDVVPVIHQRARCGTWAARWSSAQLDTAAVLDTHTAATAAGELPTGPPPPPPRPPVELPAAAWPDAATSTAPTRGPNPRPTGALATAGAAPP